MIYKIVTLVLLVYANCDFLQASSSQRRVFVKREKNVAELAEELIDAAETLRNAQVMAASRRVDKYADVYGSESLNKYLRRFKAATNGIDAYLASEHQHAKTTDQKTLREMREQQLAWVEE